MTINETRLRNLLRLVDEFTTIKALSDAADTDQKYLSQILNRYPLPSGKPRNIGDKLAEKLERGAGKPIGWMDMDHDTPQSAAPEHLTPMESELLRRFRRANNALKRAIMAVARIGG